MPCGKDVLFKDTSSGSGCGSVGRAVASNTGDPRFESRHRRNFVYQLNNRKGNNKEKRDREGHALKTPSLVKEQSIAREDLNRELSIILIGIFPSVKNYPNYAAAHHLQNALMLNLSEVMQRVMEFGDDSRMEF